MTQYVHRYKYLDIKIFKLSISDKFYQNYKNLNLCYWAKDFKKKHYDVKTENFCVIAIFNYSNLFHELIIIGFQNCCPLAQNNTCRFSDQRALTLALNESKPDISILFLFIKVLDNLKSIGLFFLFILIFIFEFFKNTIYHEVYSGHARLTLPYPSSIV